MFRCTLIFLLVALASVLTSAQGRRVSVAVLDLGEVQTSARVSERLTKLLSGAGASGQMKLALLDRALSRAAARGAGYAGSLNMTLGEARSLGASIGSDFYLTGDAQTIRRSSSSRPIYFESYASVFVVSTRTGRLVLWDRPSAEAESAAEAETALLAELDARAARYATTILETGAHEERKRFDTAAVDESGAVIDLSSDEGAGAKADLREPAPYRRLRPVYPDAASRAEAEATVDAAVEIGADGEVGRIEIVRWAGFGLDDEVVSLVRRMHFRPAMRDGEPVAVRVLLRYNFRRPVQAKN
ncbi:MAG: energy transducer TonB [Rubrivivax sp.]|nr:energy transducer TonB [Pyrinomonadaceae bacterium]